MELVDFKPGTKSIKNCAIIVSHPAEEVLWAGGTILTHSVWNWTIISLSGKGDVDGLDKFNKALKMLNAQGILGDLKEPDKGKQPVDLEHAAQELIPNEKYDLIITHNPDGEYTGTSLSPEISKAVINLWHDGKIATKSLWLFAYEDNKGNYFPKPVKTANIYRPLTSQTWQEKQAILTGAYEYKLDSWEAKTSPRAEAFYQFKNAYDAYNRIAESKDASSEVKAHSMKSLPIKS